MTVGPKVTRRLRSSIRPVTFSPSRLNASTFTPIADDPIGVEAAFGEPERHRHVAGGLPAQVEPAARSNAGRSTIGTWGR